MKKQFLFVTNHLQREDGVCAALLEFLNAFDYERAEVTLAVLFRVEPEIVARLDPRIRLRPVFRCYFRGLRRLVEALPKRFLYRRAAGKRRYDVEIAFQAGTPTVVVAHSPNRSATRVAWMHGFDSSQVREQARCDRVVCCARSTAEAFRKIYPDSERVSYLYNLIRDTEIRERAALPAGLKKEGVTFCTVGRLSREKGYDRLLRCWKRLADEGLFPALWIVGSGREESALKAYAAAAGLGHVSWIGFDANPYRYMRAADVFVCSSRSEGMSTACTEALLLGVPVISTDVNGARELIEPLGAGTVTENDEDALYGAVKNYLTRPGQADSWREAARQAGELHGYRARLEAARRFFAEL